MTLAELLCLFDPLEPAGTFQFRDWAEAGLGGACVRAWEGLAQVTSLGAKELIPPGVADNQCTPRPGLPQTCVWKRSRRASGL